MLDLSAARLISCAIHYVGNKHAEEGTETSQKLVPVDNLRIQSALLKYFLSPFKGDETFRLVHDTKDPNPVFQAAKAVFADPDALHEQSLLLAEHLYDRSMNPGIKGGEFFVCYFDDCYQQGETVPALGIFRCENKDMFLQLDQMNQDFYLRCEEGIALNKLDKGCLIFDREEGEGYAVNVIESGRSVDPNFWKQDFLNIRAAADSYHFTTSVLKSTKDFITKELPDEFPMSKTDTMEILQRSIDYFKENESFDKDHFAESVFVDERVIDSFRKYDEDYSKYNDLPASDNFEINSSAVKKQAKIFKSVLKLDKNFHIYIHGNREKIEKGVETDGRKYYKIYFEEEA